MQVKKNSLQLNSGYKIPDKLFNLMTSIQQGFNKEHEETNNCYSSAADGS
jgi:hypothetical protein